MKLSTRCGVGEWAASSINKDNDYLINAIDCCTTSPCVYNDLSLSPGHSIIACTAPLKYSKKKMEEVEAEAKKKKEEVEAEAKKKKEEAEA